MVRKTEPLEHARRGTESLSKRSGRAGTHAAGRGGRMAGDPGEVSHLGDAKSSQGFAARPQNDSSRAARWHHAGLRGRSASPGAASAVPAAAAQASTPARVRRIQVTVSFTVSPSRFTGLTEQPVTAVITFYDGLPGPWLYQPARRLAPGGAAGHPSAGTGSAGTQPAGTGSQQAATAIRAAVDRLADRPAGPASADCAGLYLLNDLERLASLASRIRQTARSDGSKADLGEALIARYAARFAAALAETDAACTTADAKLAGYAGLYPAGTAQPGNVPVRHAGRGVPDAPPPDARPGDQVLR
jgi:hypothetical protein